MDVKVDKDRYRVEESIVSRTAVNRDKYLSHDQIRLTTFSDMSFCDILFDLDILDIGLRTSYIILRTNENFLGPM